MNNWKLSKLKDIGCELLEMKLVDLKQRRRGVILDGVQVLEKAQKVRALPLFSVLLFIFLLVLSNVEGISSHA